MLKLYSNRLFLTSKLGPIVSRLANSSALFPAASPTSYAFFSLSNDIVTNLALENFIAESINARPELEVLLFWISEPCIVFGRHQNPWLECDVKTANERAVQVVRRYSGGGCVYHDLGNLNISFLTNRLKFERKTNLSLIKKSLEDSGLFENALFEITPRHDLFVRDQAQTEASFKITGTAARLSQKFAYHHCTLLVNARLDNMKLLKSPLASHIRTKATPSVPAKCTNLRRFLKSPQASDQTVIMKLVHSICLGFWERHRDTWALEHLFEYVRPEKIDGLEKSSRELASWEHKFGATPKFTIEIGLAGGVRVELRVENGLVVDAQVANAPQNEPELGNFLKTLSQCRLESLHLKSFIETTEKELLRSSYVLELVEFLNKNLI